MKKHLKNPKVVIALGLVAGYYIGRNWDFDFHFDAHKRGSKKAEIKEVKFNG